MTQEQERQVRVVADSRNEIADMLGEGNANPNVSFFSNESIKPLASGQLKQKLQRAIDEQKCQKTEQSNGGQQGSYERKINGSLCPIDYLTKFDYTSSETSLQGKGPENYVAKENTDIYALSDIYKYDLQTDVNQTLQNATDTSQTIQTDMTQTGPAYSKTGGTITVRYQLNSLITQEYVDDRFQESGQVKEIVDLTFSGFRVVGVATLPVEDPKSAVFKINGKEVTAEKYVEVFGTRQ